MLNGVIAEKLQTLDQVLSELRSLGQVSAEQLASDWRTRRAVERDLQVLVEVVIDVCQRLISLEEQSPATTGADAIARCVQMGALQNHAAYRKMAQFRNFIVHRYEQIDLSVLVDMLDRKLPDFDHFRSDVLAYLQSR